MKIKNTGFTLIELLIVVLIIGILAAIALPRYQKAVKRSRLSEVVLNVKALEGALDRYLLENGGFPTMWNEDLRDVLDIQLAGGTITNNGNSSFKTKNWYYDVNCGSSGCDIVVQPVGGDDIVLRSTRLPGGNAFTRRCEDNGALLWGDPPSDWCKLAQAMGFPIAF